MLNLFYTYLRKNMSRRGNNQNVTMTRNELTALIQQQVTAALQAQPQQNHVPAPRPFHYKTFMDCKPSSYSSENGAIGLIRWIEKTESVFAINNCPEADKVKFASGLLEGQALTWWNLRVIALGLEGANAMSWTQFKNEITEEYCPREEVQKLEEELAKLMMEGSDVEGYTRRFHELVTLCPRIVT